MIRINLLDARTPSTWRRFGLDGGQAVTVACTLVLLAGVGIIGWRFWTLRGESARLDAAIAGAELEASRLRSIIVEVQQFEQRRAQLQRRVTLIEQLRRNQTGPVRLLDEISRALPPMVWLTSLEQSSDGREVAIEGRCIALTGLSDLIAGLEASPYFHRLVDVVSTETEVVSEGGSELIAFGIKATFQVPGETPRAESDATPARIGM